MVDIFASLSTTIEPNSNPKAVFFGTEEKIIMPLARYLTEKSVDLFLAKNMNDAYFGDYFFYVGTDIEVKTFLEKASSSLPKTLLLLTFVSGSVQLEALVKAHPQVKTVFLTPETNLNKEEVSQIMDFFLGKPERNLNLLKKNAQIDAPIAHVFNNLLEQAVPPQKKYEFFSEETSFVQPISAAEQELVTRSVVEVQGHQPPMENENLSLKKYLIKNDPKQTRAFENNKKTSFTKFLKFGLALFILFLFVIAPLSLFAGEVGLGAIYLQKGKSDLTSGNFDIASRNLQSATFYFNIATVNLEAVAPVFEMLKLNVIYQNLTYLLSIGKETAAGATYIGRVAADGQALFWGISGKTPGVAFGSLISSMKGNLSLADNEFALIEAQLKQNNPETLLTRFPFTFFVQKNQTLPQEVTQLREYIRTANRGLGLLPEIIGLYGKRTYLVALQNNMELRPTGGFIGSFALATFESGSLKDFTVSDAYTADGALKGHIDPPEPIRIYLGQEHWYLRDSNWDPDFSKSAARMAWFLNKELDQSVDGVIAVDLYFAKSLLELTGPLDVPEFQEKISAENLYLKLQTEVHTDFFPGSTKKKDLLGSLSQILMQQLLESKNISLVHVLKEMHQAFEQKHLLAFFVSPEIQRQVVEYGWGGTIDQAAYCQHTSCTGDYLFLVDANFGLNKVNYFLERKMTDRVTLTEDGGVSHVVTVSYKNTSPKNTMLGGVYKNYFRLFTASGSELTRAQIDNQELTLKTGMVASPSSIISTQEDNLPVFAGLVEIPPQTEKVLTLEYARTVPKLTTGSSFTYKIQKQPGTEKNPLQIELHYPSFWQAHQLNHIVTQVAGINSLVNEGQISYNNSLTSDSLLEVEFQP